MLIIRIFLFVLCLGLGIVWWNTGDFLWWGVGFIISVFIFVCTLHSGSGSGWGSDGVDFFDYGGGDGGGDGGGGGGGD